MPKIESLCENSDEHDGERNRNKTHSSWDLVRIRIKCRRLPVFDDVERNGYSEIFVHIRVDLIEFRYKHMLQPVNYQLRPQHHYLE